MAYTAAGLKPGDIAWIPALTFVATANAAHRCGARVSFLDVSPQTFNIDPDELERSLERARENGALPGIVVPVHFAGVSCDMHRLREIADRFGVKLVEDACHALGGSYGNEKIGSAGYSEAAVFSLHPVKTITTGEGGLVLLNDEHAYHRIEAMRSHGIRRGEVEGDPWRGPWHMEMVSEGLNYKLSEAQAALGISQLRKINRFVEKRTRLANMYREQLADLPVQFQDIPEYATGSHHLCAALFDFDAIGKPKRRIHAELKKRGVHLYVHYYPVPLHSFYRDRYGYKDGDFPNAEAYYRNAFSLPLHPGLEESDVAYICDQIREVLQS